MIPIEATIQDIQDVLNEERSTLTDFEILGLVDLSARGRFVMRLRIRGFTYNEIRFAVKARYEEPPITTERVRAIIHKAIYKLNKPKNAWIVFPLNSLVITMIRDFGFFDVHIPQAKLLKETI